MSIFKKSTWNNIGKDISKPFVTGYQETNKAVFQPTADAFSQKTWTNIGNQIASPFEQGYQTTADFTTNSARVVSQGLTNGFGQTTQALGQGFQAVGQFGKLAGNEIWGFTKGAWNTIGGVFSWDTLILVGVTVVGGILVFTFLKAKVTKAA